MLTRYRNQMNVIRTPRLMMLMLAVVLAATPYAWLADKASAKPPSEIGINVRSTPNEIKDANLISVAYAEPVGFSGSGSYLYATDAGALWRNHQGDWNPSSVTGATYFTEVRKPSSEGSPFIALNSRSEIWKWDNNGYEEETTEEKLLTVQEEGFQAVSGYYLFAGPSTSDLRYFVTGIYDEPDSDAPPQAVVYSNLTGSLVKTDLTGAADFSPNRMDFVNGKLVIVGKGSRAYVFDPAIGPTWTKIDLPEDANYVDVAGLDPQSRESVPGMRSPVVAVADNTNNLYYEGSDGVWHSAASPTSDTMKSVAYGYGYYIAVGENGAVFSKDGMNWTEFATETPNALNDVQYFDYGEFIAVGDSGTRVTMQAPVGGYYAIDSHTFDKNEPADIEGEVTLTFNMDITDFTGIKKGSESLAQDEDYTVDLDEDEGRVFVTLKKEYLSQQPIGQLMLDFQFGKGYPSTVEFTIMDSSSPETPTLANAANNFVGVSSSYITAGNPITLSASGDRQMASGVVNGDEKYVPTSWSSSEDDAVHPFTSQTGIFHVATYTPVNAGTHTLTVVFTKQIYNGTVWEDSEDTVTKDEIIVATPAPASANAANNTVGASPGTITLGSSVALTASGDRQSLEEPARGDERYVPVSWSSTESGNSGTFTLSEGSYKSTYTPSAVGTHTITATFAKQKRTNEGWEDVDQDTKTTNVTVNSAGGSGGGGGGGVTATPSDDAVIVLVNGKSENAGTATKGNRNDQSLLTVRLDEKKLDDKLAAEGQGAVVTIPVNAKSDIVIGELNGRMIKNMENKQAVLEIKTDTATYTIPALQINIDAISAQVGQSVALQDIKVQVEIAATPAGMAEVVENAAAKGTFSIVVPPLDFRVTAVHGDQTVDVSKFNVYVERRIAVPDGVDPNRITTGVVVDPDGTVRHVPTKVVLIDGRYYAQVNSLTNSTYSIVWHPLEFGDAAKHWAKDAVNDMGSRMVIEGTGGGLFSPDRDITRAEFTAILVRGLGLKPEASSAPFSDVEATEWYAGTIQTAYAYRLIDGYADGSFRPNEKITREQAMTILAKAMEATGLKAKLGAVQSADATLDPFVDAANVSAWARSGVAASVQAGIVTGRDEGKLAPKAYITRAEVAVTIQRLLQRSGLI